MPAFRLLALCLALFVISFPELVEAQDEQVEVLLIRTEDSLTFMALGTQSFTFYDIRLDIVQPGKAVRSVYLEDYPTFEMLGTTLLQPPLCLHIVLEESSHNPPIECQRLEVSQFHIQTVPESERFWFNADTEQDYPITVYQGTNRSPIGTCEPFALECALHFISLPLLPPMFAPTATIRPTLPPGPFDAIAIGALVQIASLEPAFPLREQPSMQAEIITTISRSDSGQIIGGPEYVSEVSADQILQEFIWWQVETLDGTEGWIQETYYDEPILVLIDSANPILPATCLLTTFGDVTIRSGPDIAYEKVASRQGEGQVLAADGQFGNFSEPTAHWWRLAPGFWIRNDQVSEDNRLACNNLPVVRR